MRAVDGAMRYRQMLVGANVRPELARLAPSRATAGGQRANLIDYTTDGADIERSGWVKDEKILTRQNVGTLKLKWKLETGNQPRALHALMPVLVIGQLTTPGGVKQVGIVNGISDNLYAFDVESGKILWQKHWDYPAPAGRGGAAAAPQDPKRLGFLQPGGSSDTPVIGPPTRRAGGRSTSSLATGCSTSSTPPTARTCSRRTSSTAERAGR